MKIYKPLMIKLLKRADCIIVATEGHIKGSKYLLPYKDKCVIIPFGINIKALVSTVEKKAPNQTEHKEAKKVLFIGRLIYYKGIDVLLNAFSHVHGAKLLIVGDGPLRNQLEKQALDLKIENNVEFLGHLKDKNVKDLLCECDMLVLPSTANSEAFGLVQIEAMAFSKPVINTQLPTGVPYVSIHEQTGLTVSPGDVLELGKAIQRLVDNDDERIEMGIKAKERAAKFFDLNHMLDDIYTLYQNMLK
jgi:rhamnosyl/mannosyltransferase